MKCGRLGTWCASQVEPKRFKTINGWLTILWFGAAFPICVYLAESVPFLVFVSVYAVVTGHLSSWVSGRVEVRQEEDQTERIVNEIREAIHELKEAS